MKDVDKYISPLHYSNDPKSEFEQILLEAGFQHYEVEVRLKTYSYLCPQILQGGCQLSSSATILCTIITFAFYNKIFSTSNR